LRGEEEKIKVTMVKAFSSFEDFIPNRPNMKGKPKYVLKKPHLLITRSLNIPDEGEIEEEEDKDIIFTMEFKK